MNILRPLIAYGIDPKRITIEPFRKIKIAPTKGGGNLTMRMLVGHVPVISTSLSEAIEQVKAGKARVIAVSAPDPLPGDLANIPTWRSLGFDVAIRDWRGAFARGSGVLGADVWRIGQIGGVEKRTTAARLV